jgi:hypothetical protein
MAPITNTDHLNGGRWREVTFRPDEQNPETTHKPERVFVREPPLARLPELMALIGDMPAYLTLVTGKNRAWVDSLTDESIYDLYDAGRALNDPRFDLWMERQLQTVKALKPVTDKLSTFMTFVPTPPSPSASPQEKSG